MPLGLRGQQLLRARGAGEFGALDGDPLRVVAAEVGGVDDHAVHDSRHTQADQRPVVVLGGRVRVPGAGAAPPPGLPTVHDLALVAEGVRPELGRARKQQVLPFGEQLVVGGEDRAAEPAVGEVDQAGEGELGGAVVGVGVAAPVRRGVGVGQLVGTGRWVPVGGHASTLGPGDPSGPSQRTEQTVQSD